MFNNCRGRTSHKPGLKAGLIDVMAAIFSVGCFQYTIKIITLYKMFYGCKYHREEGFCKYTAGGGENAGNQHFSFSALMFQPLKKKRHLIYILLVVYKCISHEHRILLMGKRVVQSVDMKCGFFFFFFFLLLVSFNFIFVMPLCFLPLSFFERELDLLRFFIISLDIKTVLTVL